MYATNSSTVEYDERPPTKKSSALKNTLTLIWRIQFHFGQKLLQYDRDLLEAFVVFDVILNQLG
jgi:hypothetical protein